MAYATRLQVQFTNHRGDTYIVKVLDRDWVAATGDMTLAEDGFVISYNSNADEKNRFDTLVPSQCNIAISYTGADSTINAFYTDLLQYQEDRFYIEIARPSSIIPRLKPVIWRGKIVQDLVTVADIQNSRFIEITASCGLNSLESVSVEDLGADLGVAFRGGNFVEFVVAALKQALPRDMWASGDEFLRTVVEWYEDQQAGVTIDPFRHSRFRYQDVLWTFNNDGEREFINVKEALDIILKAWGCRLFMADGRWNLIQIAQYKNANLNINSYTYEYKSFNNDPDDDNQAGATIIRQNVSEQVAYDYDEVIAGGEFTWLPALKEVRVTYDYENSTGITGSDKYRANSLYVTGPLPIATFDQFGSAGIIIELTSKLIIYNFSVSGVPIPFTFQQDFVYTITYAGYYLSGTNSQATWTTTPSTYTHTINCFDPGIGTILGEGTDTISVNIPAATGTLEVDLANMTVTTPNITTSFPGTISLFDIRYAIDEDGESIDFVASNADATKSSVIADLGSVKLGDLPNSAEKYKIEVWNGTAWVESEDWRIEDTGTAYAFTELLILDYLRGQKKPLLMYAGEFISNLSFYYSVIRDSRRFMFMNGEFNGKLSQWSGEWVEMAYDATNITLSSEQNLEPGLRAFQSNFLNSVLSEITDIYKVGNNSNTISSGATVTSITIDTLPNDLFIGNKITLYNPVTKSKQLFTVSANATAGSAVAVSVTSATAADAFPTGTPIIIDNSTQQAQRNTLQVWEELSTATNPTIDRSYSHTSLCLNSGVTEVRLSTTDNRGVAMYLFNNSGSSVSLVNVDSGVTTIENEDLVYVIHLATIGWVAKVL